MARKSDEERLRIQKLASGASQVVEALNGEKSDTVRARHVSDSLCHRCRQRIERRPYHEINGEMYHDPDCVKVF